MQGAPEQQGVELGRSEGATCLNNVEDVNMLPEKSEYNTDDEDMLIPASMSAE